jgi:hypothetical protein
MPIIEYALNVHAPQAEVYRISQDYEVRFDWDPFPDRLEMVGGGDYTARVGGRVFIRSKLGMEMVVEFVQVKPPECAAVKMVSGPSLLEKFAGSWIFEDLGGGVTQARFRYLIHVRNSIFRPLVEFVAVAYFRHVVKRRLQGLKLYCERLAI